MTKYQRLKQRELADWREHMLEEQEGRCALCGRHCSKRDAVADHDHKTGHMRGVLHRGCNSLLGKLENNYRRYGLSFQQMMDWSLGIISYLGNTYAGNPMHPTHRTEGEKREARNAKARKRRKLKKEQHE